ncbi:hypothetical protein [[Mannheimia] succiniciproducens]|uniref:Uncharacterized protein n=1 Tax=Mannheimia succiniciproducens (strain KCTC 0769BP / MBEL55E) TaxID=221988 RepID=Q65TW9_MANSM|nr:hypothetical protein [[Mannheimia] succiniciproducens]AAU37591.1 unknown [[Mannheimia] succiniciproducens MBEL55E]
MSAKLNKFNNEIIPLWDEVLKCVNEIDGVKIPDVYAENFAYLKKIITFLSEAMSCIDADYLPNDSLNNIKAYLVNIKSYLTNSQNYSNSHVQNVENRLDELLKIIFPFILHKGKAIKGLRLGLNEYSKAITDYVENKFSEIKVTQENIDAIENKLNDELGKFSALREELEEYGESIFSENGVKDKIEELLNNSESKLSEIEELHVSIYGEDGLKQEIDNFYSNISNQNEAINELKEDSSVTLQSLEDFYNKIFGKEDENGKKVGGLKQEIEQRKIELDNFKQKQQERYEELNKQIENLLPGATSAGLSNAYNEMRNKFSGSAKWYGWGFYGSLIVLSVVIYCVRDLLIIKEIPLDKGLGISLLALLGNFAVKLPFILPALWLVIFVSKRRSEAERLTQEYAHKESLAKSYDSYKQQIEKLSEEDQNELLPVLMDNMIKAIALNPAETLDKKHQSDSPISEVLKDKNFLTSIADRVKDMSSNSK